MGSDASIYNMIRPPAQQQGPLDRYGAMMQLRAMGDASDLHQLQRRKLEEDMGEEAAFKGKIKDWVAAGGGELTPDVWAASPARAQAFTKAQTEATNSQAELLKTDRENFLAFAEDSRKKLPLVASGQMPLQAYRDEAIQRAGMFSTKPVRDAALRAAQSVPVDLADPTQVSDWARMQLVKADEFFAPKYETKNDGQTQTLWQINPAAGKVGPVAGAPTITNKMTPEQQDAAKRGWATLTETQRHHGVTEAQGAQTAGVPAGYRRTADGKGLEPIPGGPADQPTATQKDELTSIARTAATATRLKGMFKPEFVGFKGTMGELMDKYGSQVVPGIDGDQERIQFRSLAADLENQYIKAISGATVPTSEVPRLRRAIPTPADSPVQYQAKLAEMEKNLTDLPNVIRNGAKPGQPEPAKPDPAKATTFAAMPDPSRYNGRRIKADDGTIYKSDGKAWKRLGG